MIRCNINERKVFKGNTAVEKCINITSSDVAFDGGSHFIVGNSAASGTIGIYVNNAANNNFTGNNASNNSIGIYLRNSSNNNIYNNYFNNTINVNGDGSPNYWNTTKQSAINIINGSYLGGNFWASPDGSGYSQNCAVSNADGICDLPYVLDTNNTDYLPLSNLLPSFRYINGTVVDSISKEGIAGVRVFIDSNNSTMTNGTGFYSLNVTAGTYNLTATLDPAYYTNNSVTVSTASAAVVLQDIELVKKPTGNITGKVVRYSFVTISSPQNTTYRTTDIPLIVSVDIVITTWQYSLNGAGNVTFTLGTNITAIQGWNDLVVYAQDSGGKWDSNSVSFFVDSIAPGSVRDLQNVSYATNYINWTWTDPSDSDFSKVMVYLDGEYQGDVLKGRQYYNASGLVPGRYTIGTRTVDEAGNINTTMQTHTATTIMPPERYINGTVMDSVNKTGIEGVNVSTNTSVSTMTNGTGFYSLQVTGGSFELTAALEPMYYTNNSVTVSTEFRAVVMQDTELVEKPKGTITGSVTNG